MSATAIEVTCPQCNTAFTVDDPGYQECPHCNQLVDVARPKYKAEPVRPEPTPTAAQAVPIPTLKLCRYCLEEIAPAALKCKHCGEFVRRKTGSDLIVGVGVLVMIASGLYLIDSLLANTTIASGQGDRIHNIGLMHNQLVAVTTAGIGVLLGVGIAIFGRR